MINQTATDNLKFLTDPTFKMSTDYLFWLFQMKKIKDLFQIIIRQLWK